MNLAKLCIGFSLALSGVASAAGFTCMGQDSGLTVFKASFGPNFSDVRNIVFIQKSHVLKMKKESLTREMDFAKTYSFKSVLNYSNTSQQNDSYLGSRTQLIYYLHEDVEFSSYSLYLTIDQAAIKDSKFKARFEMFFNGYSANNEGRTAFDDKLVCYVN